MNPGQKIQRFIATSCICFYFMLAGTCSYSQSFKEDFTPPAKSTSSAKNSNINTARWNTKESVPVDLNGDGKIDDWEVFKKTIIVDTIGFHDKTSICFMFKRADKSKVEPMFKDPNKTVHILRNEIDVASHSYRPNKEYWMHYAILVDNSFEFEKPRPADCKDTSVDHGLNPDITGQLHFTEEAGASTPPLSVRIIQNSWYVYVDTKNSKTDKNDNGIKIFPAGEVKKNTWVEWKFHFNLSAGNNGFIEVYKNNVQIANLRGANIFEDHPFYLKIGDYKPHWFRNCSSTINNTRKLFYDDIWIDENRDRND